MKTIILVRHAKAVSRKLDIPDFDRSLQKKGENDASKIAKILNADGVQAGLFISSPANRALETAHIFAKELGYPIQKVVIKDTLYNDNSPQKILEMIHQIDDKYSSVMIFGHNPSFDELAKLFDPKFKESMATTGVAGLRFKNKLWKTIAKGKGELKFYNYPIRKQEKKHVYENVREQLEAKLTKQMKSILAEIDRHTAETINDLIDQHSRKLAGKFLKAAKTYQVKRISESLPPKRQAKRSMKKSKTDMKKDKGSSMRKIGTKQSNPQKKKNPSGKA